VKLARIAGERREPTKRRMQAHRSSFVGLYYLMFAVRQAICTMFAIGCPRPAREGAEAPLLGGGDFQGAHRSGTAVERPCGQGGSCNSLDQDFVFRMGALARACILGVDRACALEQALLAVAHGSFCLVSVSPWEGDRLSGRGMASRPERPRCGLQVGEVCAEDSPMGVLNHQLFLYRWAYLASWTSPSWGPPVSGSRCSDWWKRFRPGPDHLDPVQGVDRQAGVVAVEDVAVLGLGVDDGWVAVADRAAQPGPGRLGASWPAQWVTETSTRSRGHAAPCR
jgi:hypothetical protein